MNRRDFLRCTGAALTSAGGQAAQTKKLNVVFILADDFGWRDSAVYGSRFYETPNIDALARRGMRFTDAYAASPLCSPTRASILTGHHPARVGITLPECHVKEEVLQASLPKTGPSNQPALEPKSATRLKLEYQTLAETLRENGYATGHFGKWHLGWEPYDALHQGFDMDLPHASIPGPSGGYLAPWKFWPGKGGKGEHIEDRMAAEAAAFMTANRYRPFFLNYWCFSVHSPIQGKAALVEKYRRKADPESPQRNPVNGAMVESLDDAVGSLVRKIDELGIADRTIIVFFSDNGGMVHLVAANAVITSNNPLRSGKASIYEGGVRVPLVVVWPGVTKPGSVSGEVVQSVDFFPTLLEMTGAKPSSGQRFDGASFVPALRGKKLQSRSVFCHFPHYIDAVAQKPATSVREGDWKLIRFYSDGPEQKDRFELYNLAEDIGEQRDRAPAMASRVTAMNRKIERFLQDTKAVVPVPNPALIAGSEPFPEGPVTTVVPVLPNTQE